MKNSQNTYHAKHLTSQGTRPTIGLLIPKILPGNYELLWSGVVDAARARDINLIGFVGESVQSPDGSKAQANILYDLVSEKKIDGLIIWSGVIGWYIVGEGLADFFRRYHPLPRVSIEEVLEGIPSILKDNYQGMREAIVHLIEVHDCRRIAFLQALEGLLWAQERYRAYTETLAVYDLPFDPNLVVTFRNWEPPMGAEGVQVLLDERQVDFDALVGNFDHLTRQAVAALQARGIRVPGDVAVVSFDDEKESRVITPPLTTVQNPIYEMGWQAVDLLLAQLRGEDVPEQIVIPTKLAVRQSCGCRSSGVIQAAVGPVTRTAEPFEMAFAARREQILFEIAQSMEELAVEGVSDWIGRLLDAFAAEIGGASPGIFVSTLEEILHQIAATDGDVAVWQRGLSALRLHLLPYLGDNEGDRLSRDGAEDLWQQARTLIGETAQRVQAYRAVQTEQRAQTLREIGARLITTFDVATLMDVLAQDLPRLAIPGCYLSLYENPQPYENLQSAPEWSRLILAYNEHGHMALAPGGQRFLSCYLMPEEVLSQKRPFHLVVEPLYFHEEQLGFVVFEVGSGEGRLYDILREEISSALQGALLVQRVQERTAELARQQYILDTFMANVPAIIYFKDRESRITKVNRAFATRFGLNDPSDVIGKTDFDLFQESEARTKYEHEQEIIRTGRPILMLEEPGRDEKWGLTTKMPLRDEHGEIIGTFGISHDITKLKQTEAALNEAKEAALEAKNAAEAANRAKSEFLTHMSHELRTPLNGILGYTQILKRDPGLPEKQQEAIDIIHQSGEHLLTLITDLLDLAKIEAHKMELSPKWFAFPKFLDRITDIMQMRAQEKVITFHYAPLTLLPAKVYADERRLRQVLLNLLGNAVKFTEHGGIVSLRVKILDTGYSILDTGNQHPASSIQHPASSIQFEVEDTGIGMTPDQLNRIFLPFEQVGDLQYRIVGTGLGLAISRQLVHLMGSELQVTSTFGTGSTFWFVVTLPVVMEEREEPPVHMRTFIGYKGRRQHVLIVDNDATNRLILRHLLEPLGFMCAEAENGREALERVHDLQPDVILIDLSMPTMSGFEIVQTIRQIPKFADVVVIAVSASAFESNEEKSRMVGCDGFVVKPVDVNRLFALLEEHLKVDWIYEGVEESAGEERPDIPIPDQSLVLPPPDELKVLYDLALKGDIFGIRKHVARLEQRDRKFRPFAAKLLQFAKTYQDEHLLTFLESYLEEKA